MCYNTACFPEWYTPVPANYRSLYLLRLLTEERRLAMPVLPVLVFLAALFTVSNQAVRAAGQLWHLQRLQAT